MAGPGILARPLNTLFPKEVTYCRPCLSLGRQGDTTGASTEFSVWDLIAVDTSEPTNATSQEPPRFAEASGGGDGDTMNCWTKAEIPEQNR